MKIIFTHLILIYSLSSYAQIPTIQWQRTYGGTENDLGYSICKTIDNNYVIVASTSSNDGDVTFNHSVGGSNSDDYWLIKIDSTGCKIWDRSYGGTFDEVPSNIIQTSDQGFIIFGTTNSNDSDVTGLHLDSTFPMYGHDGWLIKIDSSGQILWQNCYGGTDDDYGREVVFTTDSNYILAVEVNSGILYQNPTGDVNQYLGHDDYWLVKVSQFGNILWQRTLGDSHSDIPFACAELNGNEYIIVGGVETSLPGNHGGGGDVGVIKVNSSGSTIWSKCYGGYQIDDARCVIRANNNGFILVSETASDSGDISQFYGASDIWILKADSSGAILWEKSYGGSSYEIPSQVIQTNDGGMVVVGQTYSNDNWVLNSHGWNDSWIFKLDSMGYWEWGKTLGGSDQDQANSVIETQDGGYLVCGYTKSSDGDVTFNHGNEDVWVVKLSPPPLGIKQPTDQLSELTTFQNGEELILRFFSKHSGQSMAMLTNCLGQTILEQKISIREGINYIPLNSQALAGGMYFVNVKGKMNGRSKVFLK
jgi:hypothetical protein